MEILEKVKLVFSDPEKFFNSVKGEDLGEPVKYYLILLLIPTLFITLMSSLFLSGLFSTLAWYMPDIETMPAMILQTLGPIAGLFVGGMFYISMAVGSIISAVILHVIIYLFGGKKGFVNTYKATAYGNTPSVLFSWIPMVNIIFGLWSWYLVVKGLSKLQGLTMGMALLATLIPLIVFGGLFSVGMMGYMASMMLV
jgi:hypothetical protein